MDRFDEATTQSALRMSVIDGACATVMVSLAGGIFLVGFALNVLDATSVQVGILAALPVSANIAQLFGALLIEMFGKRRHLCIGAVTAGRLMWLFVLALPLAMFDGTADIRVWILVILVGISSLLGSLAGVAWLEWMSDVIPKKIRGAYFGHRNMVSAASGMVAVLAGGAFLNAWENHRGAEDPFGYIILFGAGLLAGLASSWFLTRIPDPSELATAEATGKKRFEAAAFARPFRDRNFTSLVFYVAAFMFVTQLAGPFYAVYMIENLSIDFGTITWLITFATLASLFMLRIWGPISDNMGNRPVLIVAGAAHALIPLLWVITSPGAWFLPLALAHIASGAFYSALMLAQLNILIKLSPERGRSVYIAVFNASIGIAAAVAPITGGWLLDRTSEFGWQVGDWSLNHLHLLFLGSGVLQLFVLLAIIRVREEGALPSIAVIHQLRTDLDPQTGVAGATEFLTTQANRTGGMLRGIDHMTEQWAERSEAAVARLIDRRLNRTNGFIRRSINHLTRY